MISEVFNCDCMEYMKTIPDKFFDLAIVDPPYGIGQNFNFRYDLIYDNCKPDHEYWEQLFRISKNQIVWGGNYFTNELPENRCWISWYKGNPLDSFSDFELAWTSFDEVAKAIKLESYGFNHADKLGTRQSTIHPTQKPVALYRWLINNYAEKGDKIFDSHMGSQSSRIAAYDMCFDYWGCELDKDYFEAGCKRFEQYKSQLKIFQT